MNVAVVCSAILGALIFVLGANVSRLRLAQERAGAPQYSPDPGGGLFKAVRAHGNATEYIPMLAVLMLLVGAQAPAPTLERQTPARFIGAVGTYVFGLALVVAALATVR